MRTQALLLVVAAGCAQAARYSRQEYASGAVMDRIMESKYTVWDRGRAAGVFNSSQYKSSASNADIVKCIDGLATVEEGNPLQTFKCKKTDLHDFKSHADLGSSAGEGSSSWGWTAEDGREFAAIGQADGTAFAEITSAGKLVYLGRLPAQSVNSIWREIRSYKNYMIIGSEAVAHNVQIFDMRKLLIVDPSFPKLFSTLTDLTGLAIENIPIGRVHNVVVNEELDYMVAVGAQPRDSLCKAGLIFFDLTDPSNPTSPGCAGQDGYVHDAQCVVYRGPDTRYNGRDICYGYNEDTLTIYDVTDKSGLNASIIISRTTYEGATYTHQGWVLDLNWQQYLLLDDELDEVDSVGPAASGFPVTYIMDISDLENPVNTGFYISGEKSIDHNQYVFGDKVYQSNYGAGLRVLDISSIPQDPTGAGVEEIAYFDIYPEDDANPAVEFVGTWSHYAGYPSGNILVNTIERGAFIVKLQLDAEPGHPGTSSSSSLSSVSSSSLGTSLAYSTAATTQTTSYTTSSSSLSTQSHTTSTTDYTMPASVTSSSGHSIYTSSKIGSSVVSKLTGASSIIHLPVLKPSVYPLPSYVKADAQNQAIPDVSQPSSSTLTAESELESKLKQKLEPERTSTIEAEREQQTPSETSNTRIPLQQHTGDAQQPRLGKSTTIRIVVSCIATALLLVGY